MKRIGQVADPFSDLGLFSGTPSVPNDPNDAELALLIKGGPGGGGPSTDFGTAAAGPDPGTEGGGGATTAAGVLAGGTRPGRYFGIGDVGFITGTNSSTHFDSTPF